MSPPRDRMWGLRRAIDGRRPPACPQWRGRLAIAAIIFAVTGRVQAQEFSYRGFAEANLFVYPQEVPNDSAQVLGDALLRFEPALAMRRGINLSASFDARIDTRPEVERSVRVRYWDRARLRPALATRSLMLTLAKGPFTIELGKQFIRWGAADIVNPTDRFTARDYLTVVNSDVLASTAGRLSLTGASDTVEAVFTPRLTPSRVPLLEHRWVGLDAVRAGLTLRDAGARFPDGPQLGLRWNRRYAAGGEFSIAYFQGYNHLPRVNATIVAREARADVERHFPAIRMVGADFVSALPAFTVKGEAAWVHARQRDVDDYLLWVLQLERQYREWLFIGGYVGEAVTRERPALTFAPDRGLARSVVGRAALTLDGGRSVAIEAVARQNGDGVYIKTDYSHGFAAQWRVTLRLL
ncbi:MAG: hypothetical protein AB7I50_22655, partial [Vicinamibacterales bacterium]